jgi:Heterokaryon incompatibility protein (HET)
MLLLVPCARRPSTSSLMLAGESWYLEDREATAYTAVSYAWNAGRAPHPFEPQETISDRALRVLEAAVRVCSPEAVWLDALCTPSDAVAQSKLLAGLGAIHAGAARVVVVLSHSCAQLFEDYAGGRPISLPSLKALAQDPWVSRIWTYQELATSQRVDFVLESASDTIINGAELLNHVGRAMWELEGTNPARVRELSAVDQLLDTLGAWLNTGSTPFAYQAMVGVAQRRGIRPSDRLSAIVGAIDPDRSRARSPNVLTTSEEFMTFCEARGDLSFIYCTVPRDTRPGRSWRPAADELPPVLVWHFFGNGQRGSLAGTPAWKISCVPARRRSSPTSAPSSVIGWIDGLLSAPMPRWRRSRSSGYEALASRAPLKRSSLRAVSFSRKQDLPPEPDSQWC